MTASWIINFVLGSAEFKCSCGHTSKKANWFAPYQLGFLTLLCSI